MTRQSGRDMFNPFQSRRRAGCSGAESENGFMIYAEVWFVSQDFFSEEFIASVLATDIFPVRSVRSNVRTRWWFHSTITHYGHQQEECCMHLIVVLNLVRG